jgi:hypothetical protein
MPVVKEVICHQSLRMRSFVILFVIGGLLWGCGAEQEKCAYIPPVEQPVQLEYESLSEAILRTSSKEELVEFFGRHEVMRDYFFRRGQYPSDSVFINELFRRFTHPSFDTLRAEVSRVFGDEAALQAEFNQAFSNLRYYYPDAPMPKIQTVITGMDNDLYISDSLIIVGLDYYLGDGAKFRPNMYDYLLRQYRKENIVPSVMLVLGMVQYSETDLADQTVLADMIAYGKSFYFAKRMLPCTPDSILIWYTAEEIKGATENQDVIWASLLEKEVLYSTSHIVKQRYLGERPATIEIGDKCPGRIAQWVGWQMVTSYMNNHAGITVPELMVMTNADQLFKQSRYKPVRK